MGLNARREMIGERVLPCNTPFKSEVRRLPLFGPNGDF